jgi:hypothetical protein
MAIKNALLILLILLMCWCEYLLTFNNPFRNHQYFPIHMLSSFLVLILIQQSWWGNHAKKNPFIYAAVTFSIFATFLLCCPGEHRKTLAGRIVGIFLLIIFNSM